MSILRLFHALTLLFALSCATPARAEPDATPGDAVLHLLQDKGLLPTPAQMDASPLVQQVRDKASDMVLSAMNFLGVRYRRGGNSADQGFDCSGFTRHVFQQSLGRVLPRRADQQAREAGLLAVPKDELKPGDLVFFNTMRRAFSHVGIYVGEGRFIHSPRAGGQVRIEEMGQAYWAKRFNGARRAEHAAEPAPGSAAADIAGHATATTAPVPQAGTGKAGTVNQ